MEGTVFVEIHGDIVPRFRHKHRVWQGDGSTLVVEVTPQELVLAASYGEEISYNEAKRGRKPQQWERVS